MTTTGTLATTNISPSKPFVNSNARAIAALYTPSGTTGQFTLDLTKNFMYGLLINDIVISASSHEKVEIPLTALQGQWKRFIEGEITGGTVTLGFAPDPNTYTPYPIPPAPRDGGLQLEPHFCLLIGFLSQTDPSKLIIYVEAPVNLESTDALNFPKNRPATGDLVFYITGEGLRIGRDIINKELAYTPPV